VKKIFTLLALVMTILTQAQQAEIALYEGVAPGSERWSWTEQTMGPTGSSIIMDVSRPTITPFIPAEPNGTAIIIAPGGAFHILSMDNEGFAVARKLNEMGVTAFVLKYRLVHSDPAKPENNFFTLLANGNYAKLDSINAPLVPLALQDGLTATKYVRQHAEEYGIDPGKIGFMGFSAGATLTMSVIYNAEYDSRPNFVAPIYAYADAIIGSEVPVEKTPIFIAAASDDDLGLASHSVRIYSKWLEAGQPAELHMYERGGHGFGMSKQNLPVDSWIQRFGEWLLSHGF
jgi:acetyl esterase/lipase